MSTPVLTITCEEVDLYDVLGLSRSAVPTANGPVDIKCYFNVGHYGEECDIEAMARELQRVLHIAVPEITVKVAAQRQRKEEPPRLLPADTEERTTGGNVPRPSEKG